MNATALTDSKKYDRARRAGYTHMLCFTKEHKTLGFVDELLPFCSEGDARAWVQGVNRNYDLGRLPYRVNFFYVRDMRESSS